MGLYEIDARGRKRSFALLFVYWFVLVQYVPGLAV